MPLASCKRREAIFYLGADMPVGDLLDLRGEEFSEAYRSVPQALEFGKAHNVDMVVCGEEVLRKKYSIEEMRCGHEAGDDTDTKLLFCKIPSTLGTMSFYVLRQEPAQTRLCTIPWTSTFITASGDVCPCPSASEAMGSLRETGSLEEILDGDACRLWRSNLLTGELSQLCRTCPSIRGSTVQELEDCPTSEPDILSGRSFPII